MGDPRARSDQERAADTLAEVLNAVALPVAKSRPRTPITAPSEERVATIKVLAKLGRDLPDLCRRAYLGELEGDEWADLSDTLQLAARACREQVVIDLADVGDSGGR